MTFGHTLRRAGARGFADAVAVDAPRVAVVGGGITGALAALVLKNRGAQPIILDAGKRGLGGRFSGRALMNSSGTTALATLTEPAPDHD
jgi:NADPH-dependent 2,4-dienoyl-CoA reductase/sulfur reductase-like enzyme